MRWLLEKLIRWYWNIDEKRMTRYAERGAAFMDEHSPRWYRKIDRELDIADGDDCTLGQCFGSYDRGIKTLKLTGVESVYLGFTVFRFERDRYSLLTMHKYSLLTACWKKLINQRLKKDKQEIQASAVPVSQKRHPQKPSPIHAV